MNRDWLFKSEEYICGLRAAAVIVKDNKLFVQREKNGNEYALPGGHIKIGETLEAGLIREFEEETGAEIACKHLLWSEECFWKWNGTQTHTIAFYYLSELCGGCEVPVNEFVSMKDNCDIVLGWLFIDEIQNVTIYPEFIKDEVHRLNGPIKHFTTRE